MSLLLDALKNAENIESIENKNSVDKDETTRENLVPDINSENFDQTPISKVDLEAPALTPQNKVTARDDENTQQDTVRVQAIKDSGQEADEQNLIAAQRYGLSHDTSSIDHVSHTAADYQRRKTDGSQTHPNSDKPMQWDLPSNLPSNTRAGNIEPENNQSNPATNSALSEPENSLNDPSPALAQEASDKPQFFHYSKPINHSNHKTILVAIFVLIGTAAGTILLFILNQLESQASLFSQPSPVSKTIAVSQTSIDQPVSKPVALSTNATNTIVTKANKVRVTTKATPSKTHNIDTFPIEKKRADQLIKPNTKNTQRLSSLDPVIATSKNKLQQLKPAISNDSSTTNTQNIAINQKTFTRKNVIRIIKHKISVSNNSYLMEAYRYYQQRQYNKASLLYKQILRSNHKSRDALLGLAAIAIRKMKFSQAVNYYKTLLSLDPKDRLALGGLISLKQYQNPDATVSFINHLIKQRPSAYLYFLLGNIYSSNKSWPEAQSAYFKAWNFDNAKPDYAFNLAISLDSLNQHSSALHYYQIALKLSNTNTAGFNRRLLIQRIRDLSQKTPAGPKR